jgi:competence protein ComFC
MKTASPEPSQTGPRAAVRAFLSLIYPPCCEGCGKAVEHPHYLCAHCAGGAVRIEPPFCEVCSEPFRGAIGGTFTCANCSGRDYRFTCAVSRYSGEGVVRDFIHRFKYFREYHLRHPLAAWAAEALDDPRIRAQKVDALVPVPLFRARERGREFNQAEVIARMVGRQACLPVSDCLLRTRNTTSQVAYAR